MFLGSTKRFPNKVVGKNSWGGGKEGRCGRRGEAEPWRGCLGKGRGVAEKKKPEH